MPRDITVMMRAIDIVGLSRNKLLLWSVPLGKVSERRHPPQLDWYRFNGSISSLTDCCEYRGTSSPQASSC